MSASAVTSLPASAAELDADVPNGLEAPRGHPRFPAFDGLRAAAAFAVLVSHTAAQARAEDAWFGPFFLRGNIGVTVFFVISGFLLYRPWVASRYGLGPAPRLLGYARNRVLRIVPAYWVALTGLALWPGLVGVGTGDFWRYYGFAQIYQLDTFLNGLAPAWTLCVEASFYLALPLLAVGLAFTSGRGREDAPPQRRDVALISALAVLSLVWHTLSQTQTSHVNLGFTLPGLFTWFAGGMLLAHASVAWTRFGFPSRLRVLQATPWLPWALAVALYLCVSYAIGLPRGPHFPPIDIATGHIVVEDLLYALIAVLVVAPAVIPTSGALNPSALLTLRPIAWLGLISYGVFLWHDPLIYELDTLGVMRWLPSAPFIAITVATVVVTLPLATASYYLVERPALRRKSR